MYYHVKMLNSTFLIFSSRFVWMLWCSFKHVVIIPLLMPQPKNTRNSASLEAGLWLWASDLLCLQWFFPSLVNDIMPTSYLTRHVTGRLQTSIMNAAIPHPISPKPTQPVLVKLVCKNDHTQLVTNASIHLNRKEWVIVHLYGNLTQQVHVSSFRWSYKIYGLSCLSMTRGLPSVIFDPFWCFVKTNVGNLSRLTA